jgi:hypothetical protein
MDITGMVVDLRLELDRIERSILILEELACPNRISWAVTPKRASGVRKGRVISIERRTNRREKTGVPLVRSPLNDLSRTLRELQDQTAQLKEAVSALAPKPGN